MPARFGESERKSDLLFPHAQRRPKPRPKENLTALTKVAVTVLFTPFVLVVFTTTLAVLVNLLVTVFLLGQQYFPEKVRPLLL